MGANATMTTCACNHLTSFGSGFFVAPNAIDFSYVFANAGFLDNLTIYLTLIISLALYFIGLVYSRIMVSHLLSLSIWFVFSVFCERTFSRNDQLMEWLQLTNYQLLILFLFSLSLYKDRKDVEKVGVIPLADNEPTDQYLYVLIVHTGHIPNAGTKSKVSSQIFFFL